MPASPDTLTRFAKLETTCVLQSTELVSSREEELMGESVCPVDIHIDAQRIRRIEKAEEIGAVGPACFEKQIPRRAGSYSRWSYRAAIATRPDGCR